MAKRYGLRSCGALLLLISACVRADECPTLPLPPVPTAADLAFYSAWQGVAEPYSASRAGTGNAEPSYGVGHLHISEEDEAWYDWPRRITLPLWKAPEETAFYGWIHSGRVHMAGNAPPYALSGIGMVETDYELLSLIVQERSSGGWMRLSVSRGSSGMVWTHQCHLDVGEVRLVYENWESFLQRHGQWLHFRAQVPHMLRKHPDINSRLVTKIGLDHKLVLHEFSGDWMRVTVEQPDLTCAGPEAAESQPTSHEGWVKWRDDEKGPWTWIYTRGC